VPPGLTVGHVQVRVNINYPIDGDLILRLTSPHGTTILLVGRRGGTRANFRNTVFDDAAGTSIVHGNAPYGGSFRPEWELNRLNGQDAAGVWKLSIEDVGGHSGTLLNWSLVLTPAASR
jgi:subtilisin-like proprotein convertase family protein